MTTEGYSPEQRRDIYRQAIARYGTMSQIMVAIEEMSELTKELCKLGRDQTTNEKLASEMADVAIMLEQLRLIFDIDELVAGETYRKIRRLQNNLEKGAN